MSDFSVSDLCVILKSSKECGVVRLKIGTFEVSFLPDETKAQTAITLTPDQIRATKEYQNKVFEENEARVRLENLSNLRLEHPEEYEELIARGELETDAGQESDGVGPS